MNRLYKYTDFSHAVNNSNRDGRTSGEYVCEAYVVPFEKGQILLHTPQEALKRAAKSYYSFLSGAIVKAKVAAARIANHRIILIVSVYFKKKSLAKAAANITKAAFPKKWLKKCRLPSVNNVFIQTIYHKTIELSRKLTNYETQDTKQL